MIRGPVSSQGFMTQSKSSLGKAQRVQVDDIVGSEAEEEEREEDEDEEEHAVAVETSSTPLVETGKGSKPKGRSSFMQRKLEAARAEAMASFSENDSSFGQKPAYTSRLQRHLQQQKDHAGAYVPVAKPSQALTMAQRKHMAACGSESLTLKRRVSRLEKMKAEEHVDLASASGPSLTSAQRKHMAACGSDALTLKKSVSRLERMKQNAKTSGGAVNVFETRPRDADKQKTGSAAPISQVFPSQSLPKEQPKPQPQPRPRRSSGPASNVFAAVSATSTSDDSEERRRGRRRAPSHSYRSNIFSLGQTGTAGPTRNPFAR